jgi:hypothetical protein
MACRVANPAPKMARRPIPVVPFIYAPIQSLVPTIGWLLERASGAEDTPDNSARLYQISRKPVSPEFQNSGQWKVKDALAWDPGNSNATTASAIASAVGRACRRESIS